MEIDLNQAGLFVYFRILISVKTTIMNNDYLVPFLLKV
jgi:hypothetical protein